MIAWSKFPRKNSLYITLVVPFILQLIIVVSLISYFSIHNGQQVVKTLVTELQTKMTHDVSNYLNYYLDYPHLINQNNAAAIQLNQLQVDDFNILQRYFWQQLQLYPHIGNLAYGNEEGAFLAVERNPNQLDQLQLVTTGTHTQGNMEIYTLDSQGQRSVKPVISKPAFDPRERSWYQFTKQNPRPNWSSVFNFFSNSLLVLPANLPVYDEQNRFKGVLTSRLYLSQLNQFLQSLTEKPGSEIFILESPDLVIASSVAEQLPMERLSAQRSQNPLLAQPTQYLLQQFEKLANIDKPAYFTLKINQTPYFLSVTPWQHQYHLHWFIIILIPQKTFMQPIWENQQFNLLLTFISVIFIILTSLLTAHRIIQPLLRLAQTARHLSYGKWQHSVDLQRQDEIGDLNNSFNRMVQQLKDSFQILQQDILTRQRMQTALQASQFCLQETLEWQQAIFDNSSIGILVVTDNRIIREVNNKLLDMFGYQQPELIGKSSRILHLSRQHFEKFGREVYAKTAYENVQVDYPMQHRDGHLLWCEISGQAIDKQDLTKGVVWVLLEINKRKQAEEEAARRKSFLLTLIEVQRCLLSFKDKAFPYEEILDLLSPIAEATRMAIYRVYNEDQNAWEMANQAEWCVQGAKTDHPLILPRRWRQILHQGNLIIGQLVDFPPEERDVLMERDTLSILILPLFNEMLLGFIILENCEKPYQWSSMEISLLQTLTSDIAFAKEHQLTERTLKQTHQRFATVLDSIHALIYVTDIYSEEILFINQYGKNLFGEIEGQKYWQTIQASPYPHDPLTHHIYPFTEQDNHLQSWEFYHTKLKKWFYIQEQAITWIDGRQVYLGIATDISERKQVEDALRSSQEHLAEAQEIAHLGYWEWNLITGQQQWSQQMVELFQGTAPKNLPLPEIFEHAIHREDIDGVMAAFETAFHNNQAYQTQFRIQNYQGETHYIQALGRLIRDEEGRPLRLMGTAQDITSLKKTEEALRKSEKQFKAIFNNAATGISLINRQGYYIDCNKKWNDLLGYSHAEIFKKHFTDITYPEDVAESLQKMQQLLSGDLDTYDLEKRFVRKDGSLFWANVWVSILPDKTQQIESVICIIFDITAHKQAEENLKKAKETAEVANHAKSTFLANISHELRTPLNAILGYTQIFQQDDALNEKQKEGIDIIHRSGQHLLMLINDILDISKIEAGKLELIPSDFNFIHFLQNTADLVRMRAEQKDLQFYFLVDKTHLPTIIHADEIRLRQVLLNLLSNAVKFTDRGWVNFAVQATPQGNILFKVEDSGVGIEPHQLNHIFLPFQQAHHKHHKAEGTGLGLSISKRLVDMMGGHLSVDSELGKGTQFWFELSFQEKLLDENAPSQKTPKIVGYQGRRQKVLIVDDQWVNRAILVKLLEKLGFYIFEADNGLKALKLAYETLPDVMLLDLMMPDMDGFQVAKQIRQSDYLQNMKIIAISACAYEQDQQRSLEAGCNTFIAKPLETEILLKLLQEELDLQWIYQKDEEKPANKKNHFIVPEIASLQSLYDLVLVGDISGILDKINELEEENSEWGEFVDHIRHLAKGFKMSLIEEFLKRYLL